VSDHDVVSDAVERLEWSERAEEPTPLSRWREVTRRGALMGSAAGAVALALQACGGDDDNTAGAAGGGATDVFGEQRKMKFTFVNHVTTNPFFVPTKYGAEDACNLLGCSYQWTGSESSNVNEMVNAFNSAVSAKVDGIAVALVDLKAFNGPIQKALDAGIAEDAEPGPDLLDAGFGHPEGSEPVHHRGRRDRPVTLVRVGHHREARFDPQPADRPGPPLPRERPRFEAGSAGPIPGGHAVREGLLPESGADGRGRAGDAPGERHVVRTFQRDQMAYATAGLRGDAPVDRTAQRRAGAGAGHRRLLGRSRGGACGHATRRPAVRAIGRSPGRPSPGGRAWPHPGAPL